CHLHHVITMQLSSSYYFFLHDHRHHRHLHSFPTRRSSDLTPAPWINVVANPGFGFHVAADGGGFTWALNSRENQLTPWSNDPVRSEEHTSELQSLRHLVCRLLLEKKNYNEREQNQTSTTAS